MSIHRDPLFTQFRRLFLGTMLEMLVETGLGARYETLQVTFDERSVFKVPRWDNYMLFVGEATVELTAEPDDRTLARLRAELRRAWPDLVGCIKIPVGDKLTPDRNELEVTLQPGDPPRLRIEFDLMAD